MSYEEEWKQFELQLVSGFKSILVSNEEATKETLEKVCASGERSFEFYEGALKSATQFIEYVLQPNFTPSSHPRQYALVACLAYAKSIARKGIEDKLVDIQLRENFLRQYEQYYEFVMQQMSNMRGLVDKGKDREISYYGGYAEGVRLMLGETPCTPDQTESRELFSFLLSYCAHKIFVTPELN